MIFTHCQFSIIFQRSNFRTIKNVHNDSVVWLWYFVLRVQTRDGFRKSIMQREFSAFLYRFSVRDWNESQDWFSRIPKVTFGAMTESKKKLLSTSIFVFFYCFRAWIPNWRKRKTKLIVGLKWKCFFSIHWKRKTVQSYRFEWPLPFIIKVHFCVLYHFSLTLVTVIFENYCFLFIAFQRKTHDLMFWISCCSLAFPPLFSSLSWKVKRTHLWMAVTDTDSWILNVYRKRHFSKLQTVQL